jgi:hypothetical protein
VSRENSNDTFGNRTSYLPACTAVPQPTASQRTAQIFWKASIIAYGRASRFVPFVNFYQGYEIKVNEMGRGVSRGDDKCIDAVGKVERNNPRGISSRRCEDNIKLTLKYFGAVKTWTGIIWLGTGRSARLL